MVWSSDPGAEVGIGRDRWSEKYLDDGDWVAAAFDVGAPKTSCAQWLGWCNSVLGADAIVCTTMMDVG
jgi:hypothetical protein